jgi:hypothetical protein
MPGPIPSWGGRRAKKTGGKILHIHVYCIEEKVTMWITLEFSCF